MLEIPLSTVNALPFDFGGAVDFHIKALKAHQLTERKAAPSAPHPLVEQAVARVQYPVEDGKPDDFVPNYKLVGDPVALQKQALADQASVAAASAIAAILPPLKSSLWAFQAHDAYAVDGKKRTAEHKATIRAHEDRQKRVEAVHRHLAQLHGDIHDLTDATVNGWKAAPFPT